MSKNPPGRPGDNFFIECLQFFDVMKDERFGRFNHYFLRFSLTLCLCLAVFLTGCAVEVESSDADEQDMAEPVLLDSPSDTSNSDSSSIFSYESIKKTIIRIIDAAVELADSHEGKTGETININSQIDVTASSGPYKIWSGNIYKFSSKGSIDVKEGGVLWFGTSFMVEGEPATIHMDKGSSLSVFGVNIEIPADVDIVLDGYLKFDVDLIADVAALNVDTSIKGDVDLEGTLKVNGYTIQGRDGSEFSIDLQVISTLDSGSAIKNLKDITDLVFSIENGMTFDIKLNDLNVNFGGSLFNIDASGRTVEVAIESPLGEEGFIVKKINVARLVGEVKFLMGIMDNIVLAISNISTIEEGGRTMFYIQDFKYSIESLAEVRENIKFNYAQISLDFGERAELTIHSGNMDTLMGYMDMDVTVLEGGYFYCGSTKYTGSLNAANRDCVSGDLEVPYRSITHLVIGDEMDIRFAGDEDAYLSIFVDLNLQTHIYPAEGLELLEFHSERYVEYVKDEFFSYAVPVSLKGIYHAELGEREYTIYFDDTEVFKKARATTVVDLPQPEPRLGMKFLGWNDNIFTYRDKYEMPAHDVFMTSIWTGFDDKITMGEDYLKVTSNHDAVEIREDRMGLIRSYFEKGQVSFLRIQTPTILIDIDGASVLKTEGAVSLILTVCYPSAIPEYEKSIEPGMLYIVELLDDNGVFESTTGTYTISVTYHNLLEKDNVVRMYSMDDVGRLTELEGTYEIISGTEEEQSYANVTFTTNSVPFTVIKSSYEPDVGAARTMLLISLLPVLIVGLILAFITRRR